MKQVIFFLVIYFLTGCSNKPKNLTAKNEKINNEIKVEINHNIETVGIILILSDLGDYVLKNYKGNEYSLIKLYRKEFKKFKQHPAVLKANELGKKDLLQFGYFYYGLSFNTLPEFKKIHKRFDEYYLSKKLSKEEIEIDLEKFDELIRKFYKDAKLNDFFLNHKIFYSQIKNEVKKSIPNNIISVMENYFKNYENEYIIIPSPTIFTGWNFGPNIKGNNKTIFYYVTGPTDDINPKRNSIDEINKDDNLGFVDPDYYKELAIHEFGHSFIRFIDKDRNKKLWESLSYLNNEQLKKNFERIGEGTEWNTVFEEHLVRANEIMIWKEMANEKMANEKLEYEKSQGILYIEDFVNALDKYRVNKENYKSFEAFFPELINNLKMIKKQ